MNANINGKSRRTWLFVGFGVAILAVLIAGVFLILRALENQTPSVVRPAGPQGWVVDENNLEDVRNAMEEQVAEGYFETEMNMFWNFPSSSEASTDAVAANSANNIFPCYFTVTLDETSEVVYTSPLIPVGKMVSNIVLDTDLSAGTYPAVCKYYMIDEEKTDPELQVKGEVSVRITIDIKQ